MSEEPDKKQWGTLAKKLHFSRTALFNWKTKLPGAPQEPDLDAWKIFIAENELGVSGNRQSEEREELLKEKLQTEIALNRLKIAKEERTVVDRTVVDQLFLRLGSLQKTVLYQHLEKQMPAKAAAHGAAVEAMQVLGRETADALCEIFNQEMDKWQSTI